MFSILEEVICRINPANSDLFAGLIRQIVSYLPDYNPANSDLFAGLIRQIVAYLPDYENFSVLLDDISVHVVLCCRRRLPELFQ